jgi:hypothetical protein
MVSYSLRNPAPVSFLWLVTWFIPL